MAVTPNDVADRLGLPRPAADSPKYLQWQAFIDQALYLIERYRVLHALDAPDPADVDYVVLESVTSLVRHPDDATTVDVSVDDGRVAKTYSSGTGRIDLTPWWSYLWPSVATSSEAFTITPYYAPPTCIDPGVAYRPPIEW